MKIFLSPSNQKANIGAYVNTNECEQCNAIAVAANNYLVENYICQVTVAAQGDNMKARASYANVQNMDIYVAIHTNAFGDTSVTGTETFFYSADTRGRALAELLLDRVSALTNVKRRAKANDSLIELNTPNCTRAYLEVDFHSNPERAKWICDNTRLIGETVAKAIADFAGLTKRSVAENEEQFEQVKQELITEEFINENMDKILDMIRSRFSPERLYRVQAGAFTVKANARKLAQRLKDAGFGAVVKYE